MARTSSVVQLKLPLCKSPSLRSALQVSAEMSFKGGICNRGWYSISWKSFKLIRWDQFDNSTSKASSRLSPTTLMQWPLSVVVPYAQAGASAKLVGPNYLIRSS